LKISAISLAVALMAIVSIVAAVQNVSAQYNGGLINVPVTQTYPTTQTQTITYPSIAGIHDTTRQMNKITDFSEECTYLVDQGDTSRMFECASAMADLAPVLRQYILNHPIIEEFS